MRQFRATSNGEGYPKRELPAIPLLFIQVRWNLGQHDVMLHTFQAAIPEHKHHACWQVPIRNKRHRSFRQVRATCRATFATLGTACETLSPHLMVVLGANSSQVYLSVSASQKLCIVLSFVGGDVVTSRRPAYPAST